ncbi:uncharacterized protein KIAA0930 homolog isoform X2 [Centruroides vittatus]|uniref:uncharacterized protein KIAA0930 homolog isoform X2 n=1 Tax=Centruroides vittatus TaxID=120091 RepID=UPI00350F9EE8
MACRLLDRNLIEDGFFDKFDYILTDCDGVLWDGNDALPGSAETVNALRSKGKKILYVTNNSTKTKEDYVKKCEKLGFIASVDEMFPTSLCVAIYLKSLNFDKLVYLIGSAGIVKELEAVGISCLPIGPDPISNDWIEWVKNLRIDPKVGAVVVGFDEHISYPKMIKAASYLKNPDCLFIATNTDEQFPTSTDLIIPGTGTFVTAIKTVSGRNPIVLGKPNKYMFETIKIQHPNINPSRCLMIGDRLNTDIMLGRKNGMQTLLVLTGISDLKEVESRKEENLPDSELMIPDYYIESLGQVGKVLDSGFVLLNPSTFWTDLFVRFFLHHEDDQIRDDLLFFVRKQAKRCNTRIIPQYELLIEVFRKDSKKLPIGDGDIDWEETVYLNLILQQLEYTLTCAICTRTSSKDLQILKRHSQRVYASPSRRSMDCKGEMEEISYPNIFFMVDNYDEVFQDIVVRDGEIVCVELLATDREGTLQGVIFLGSIRYEALKRVYDARASLSTRVAQRVSMGWYQGQQRLEFVRMRGPNGKGHAEMAVTKPKGSGAETPTSEPGFCMTEFEWEDLDENPYMQRRMSDPSSNLNNFVRGWKTRQEMKKSQSENEGVDSYANGINEIEAGDIRDELDDTTYNRLWTMKGFSQAYHFWKESRRASSPALHAYLTYVTLPWHHIITDLLNIQQEPVLTF